MPTQICMRFKYGGLVPDFVSQLWRQIRFFSKAVRQNPEWKGVGGGGWVVVGGGGHSSVWTLKPGPSAKFLHWKAFHCSL